MIHLLVAVLLSLLLPSYTAEATHVKLTWRPFTDSPAKHGYKKWCTSEDVLVVYESGKSIGYYTCDADLIAVWNADGLPNDQLEFATPCGTNGYAIREYVYPFCHGPTWMACLGDASPTSTSINCFGFKWKDDVNFTCILYLGYWPTNFNRGNLPKKVEVWYQHRFF